MVKAWQIEPKELEEKILSKSTAYFNRGEGAESFLLGALQRREWQLDVMRPPVDYGIDVIALDRATLLADTPSYYYFQVKSHVLEDRDFVAEPEPGDSKRPYYHFYFDVASTTLNLMRGRKNFAIVVYLFLGREVENASRYLANDDIPFMYFWLNGADFGDEAKLKLNELEEVKKSQSFNSPYYRIYARLVMRDEKNARSSLQVWVSPTEERGDFQYIGRNNKESDDARFNMDGFLKSANS